jgi:voltage-gated potassium channel
MLAQILIALALTAVTVLIHANGTILAIRSLIRRIEHGTPHRPVALVAPLALLVSALLLLSVAEMLLWAGLYAVTGDLPDFETAAYFSFTSYTTVGYGDVVLPQGVRLLGPIEGAVGVLMFGWSTGVLVAAIGRIAATMGGLGLDGPH